MTDPDRAREAAEARASDQRETARKFLRSLSISFWSGSLDKAVDMLAEILAAERAAERAKTKAVVEAARAIFDSRAGAYGTALWENRGEYEFVEDIEALRKALAALDDKEGLDAKSQAT